MNLIGWIIVGVAAVWVVISASIPNKRIYKCPKCGKTFVPKKSQLLGVHSLGKNMLKCPYCGETCMMGPAGKDDK